MKIIVPIPTNKHLLFLFICCIACIQDDSYDIPLGNLSPKDIPEDQIVSISALRAAWAQELNTSGNQTLTFDDTYANQFVEGYVISSDENGNFFEEVVIQDQAESPTAGLKVLIDSNPLYPRFNFGRHLYVSLQGLTVGLDSGVLALGYEDGGVIQPISEASITTLIVRDTLVADMVPLQVEFAEISESFTNLWLHMNEVQFHRSEVLGTNPLTYAGEPGDEFDGERILESCSEGSQLIFSTSTFSSFKSQQLAQGKGHIDGILAFDYFGEYPIIRVNGPQDIHLDEEDRCDPEFFVCEGTSEGNEVIWNENFEDGNSMDDYVINGWTNTNLAGGATVWSIQNFSGNQYAQITGYNSNESEINSWFISPAVNLDSSVDKTLYFDIQTAYYNRSILNVWITQEFSGDIEDSEWFLLDAFVPTGPSDGFGDAETIGPINLSCIEGAFYIGFQYEGSDPSATTRYHLDNIKIKGN